MTLIYSDPLFLKHDTGHHPESADRLRSIHSVLHGSGLITRCVTGSYKPLTEDTVTNVHSPALVVRAKQVAEHGGGFLDADTVVSSDSFQVALAAAGACVGAVDAVLAG